MGWERDKYYTRSRKVNGRVVREYVGAGRVAELAAQLDTIERDQRHLEREAERTTRDELAALDERLDELNALTEGLARGALLAAGYRMHKRGEWRKKRVRN
jgi:flagellar biosynthesis/type III secretory pathway chaperone